MTRARLAKPQRRTTLMRVLLVAAAVAVAWVIGGVSGTNGTYAAWSSTITIPGATLKTGTAGLTVSGFTSASLSSASPNSVSTTSITNTGSATLRSFTTQTATAGSAALAANVQLAIWPLTSGSCASTAPSGAATGTWAAVPNWLGGQSALASGATATYCVLSSVTPAVLTQYPGLSITPTVQVGGATAPSGSSGGWSTGLQSATPFTLATAAAPSPFTVNSGVAVSYTTSAGSNGGVCYAVTMASIDGSKITWSLTVDNTVAPFSTVPVTQWTWPNGVKASWNTNNPARTILTGIGGTGTNGDNNGNNKTVSAGITVTLNFCVGG